MCRKAFVKTAPKYKPLGYWRLGDNIKKKYTQQKLCASRKTGGGRGSNSLFEPSVKRRQERIGDRGGGGGNERAN